MPDSQKSTTQATAKPTLVLLPGLLCDEALWAPQVEALANSVTSWVADLKRDDTIEAMAQRVLDEAPAERFALAALSMGGYVALEIMRRAPQRVMRLALLDTRSRADDPEDTQRRVTFMRLAESEGGFTPITSRMLPLLVHPARVNDTVLVQTIRDMADRTGVTAYVRQQTAMIARADYRPLLPAIACPTLVLCGREDVLTPLAMHTELAAGIPNSKLVVLEQCGHLSTLERPLEVSAALRAWLRDR
ncbi:MAG: alpha/beta fold hydrolase [Betaproteobacteria bacterium]